MSNTDADRTTTEFLAYGTYRPKLDDKGRLTIPAKLRAGISDGLVITNWFNEALSVFSLVEFEALKKRVRPQSHDTDSNLKFWRILNAGAEQQICDKQGRIVVSAQHRKYAHLEKECVVTGVGDRLEIWNPDTWDAYIGSGLEAFGSAENFSFSSGI